MTKIYIGCDHNGFLIKERLIDYFKKHKIDYDDLSPRLIKDDDYPDIAAIVAKKVAKNKAKGILICGSGAGMAIAANKIKGIRAAVTRDIIEAELEREHNDINIMCLNGLEIGRKIISHKPLSQQFKPVSVKKITKLVGIFLNTESFQGRHKRRVEKIKKLEN